MWHPDPASSILCTFKCENSHERVLANTHTHRITLCPYWKLLAELDTFQFRKQSCSLLRGQGTCFTAAVHTACPSLGLILAIYLGCDDWSYL